MGSRIVWICWRKTDSMGTGLPEIDQDKCTGCGNCAEYCPCGAISLVTGRATIVRPEECDYCTDCEVICLPGAIRCPFEIILAQH